LDVKDFEIVAVFRENAATLAELGDASIAGAALRDCDLACLLRASAVMNLAFVIIVPPVVAAFACWTTTATI
jgi:hypothetical protein